MGAYKTESYNEPEAIRMKRIAILKGIKPRDYGIYMLYPSKEMKNSNAANFRCLKVFLVYC
ncbi:MAG: hypothetical protein QW633_03235 [Candidatus Aenigmatarchaeota archaeon]